jgi:hypothetical protein
VPFITGIVAFRVALPGIANLGTNTLPTFLPSFNSTLAALNGALQVVDHFKDKGLIFSFGPAGVDFDFLKLRFRQKDFTEFVCGKYIPRDCTVTDRYKK